MSATTSRWPSCRRIIRQALANGERFRAHAFELACAKADIDHRTTKLKHPWTNGQVLRMSRTIKDATVKRYDYDSHDQLERHPQDFASAYNFGRRLKAFKGLTSQELISKTLEFRARTIHTRPNSANAGTENLEPIGNIPPAEAADRYFPMLDEPAIAA